MDKDLRPLARYWWRGKAGQAKLLCHGEYTDKRLCSRMTHGLVQVLAQDMDLMWCTREQHEADTGDLRITNCLHRESLSSNWILHLICGLSMMAQG